MKISFSKETKDAIAKIEIKKKCCRRTFSDTVASLTKADDSISVQNVLDNVRCDNCVNEFLRAAFITVGGVTDPEKRYHLDFTLSTEEDRDAIVHALETVGFVAGMTLRKEKYVAYFKDNDVISDLLAYLGATKAAFEVMNSKIVKEVRNNANRLVNCDTANITKALNASQKYLEAIEYIKGNGGITALPSELREAAELREAYKQASLNELAGKCQPPITKSGMKHRLEKLLAHAEELKARNEN